jgi:hypothetical protein
MSKWAGETGNRMEQLRRAIPNLEDPDTKLVAKQLIDAGREIQNAWKGIIHDEIPAPGGAEAVEFRKKFHRWEDLADGVIRAARE